MRTLTDSLSRLVPPPPLWLVLVFGTVVGAALLMALVDTLREHVRHGEELRQWQRVGVVRQPIGTVVTAAAQTQQPQLATSFSQPLQR
ncbi:hypothetical protein ACS5PN_06395 [Roseateles sp. NT4]|uniref:hypothetical protein n=1 Tax=Roseateles sp. NT4 TaxID=3453715 RepID=UPI003EEC2C9E